MPKTGAVEIVRLIMEMGWNAYQAYQSGDMGKTVEEILPQRLKDRERLEELKDQAREDYPDVIPDEPIEG